ncbi:helix-turn-helix domain-containing protein [Pedobacter cryoconitis]|nr:helix-turn-helix transcriptional regulator [Pedobacter cryoconitis]
MILNVSEPNQVLDKLAEVLETTCQDGLLIIPAAKGKGYLKGFFLGNSIGLMIRDCEFNEDLLIKRNFNLNPHERVIFSFNNILIPKIQNAAQTNVQNLPSVQIGKGKLNLEIFYPSHTNFRSILVTIYLSDLKLLLGDPIENSVLRSILETEHDILLEEIITPAIQKVALEITDNDIPQMLHPLYYRLKAEELICLVFAELLKRENAPMQAINEIDAENIYKIRAKILSDLSVAPVLEELAKEAGMSKSKLKRLFKQIFGESIFNYFQIFRMKEAARLLKEHRRSVSEVAYALGYSNLGHFTKVFEAHIGIKPKKFSLR